MALMIRLSRLIRADLNAVLDRLEEPDILLAQALHDMQEALAADEHRLDALRLDQQRIQQRREVLSRQQSTIAAELDICLDADKDDLARDLLRRRLEHERLDALLSERERDLDARLQRLGETIDRHRRRLDAIRAEAALVIATPARNDRRSTHTASDRPVPIRETDIEVALLAEKRRRLS
jgi:phage shock protein A